MSEEKIKIKAERLLFFLVGHNFYMSEDSLTVKYTESGLSYAVDNKKGKIKNALSQIKTRVHFLIGSKKQKEKETFCKIQKALASALT